MTLTRITLLASTFLATTALASPADDPGASWLSWRGPTGNGAAPADDPPVEWSEEKNVRWRIDLPGLGSSTPVIVGNRIFLTSAIETEEVGEATEGGTEKPQEREERGRGGRRGGGGQSSAPSKVHQFVVLAYDRANGAELWRTVVKAAVPHEAIHATASQASNSPVTDGEHLFASFGSRGVHCLTLDGELVWSVDLGLMHTRNQFGEGSSPALLGDTLVVPWDHEGDSFIVALSAKDGRELWRRERDERSSWATPRIVAVGERAQVILPGTTKSIAYDLRTGETVWSCEGMTQNVIPTPTYSEGIVHLMSGYRGAALQAIRVADAKGVLTPGESECIVWTHDKSTSYTPSALEYEGKLWFLRNNSGVITCLDSSTGEALYEEERLEGLRNVYSSPVGAGGRVYVTSREGTTVVLDAGAEPKVLATNQLDDGFDASAVIIDDALYLRGMKHLYCIAEAKPEAGKKL